MPSPASGAALSPRPARASTDHEPPLPRPTVVSGSRRSSLASSSRASSQTRSECSVGPSRRTTSPALRRSADNSKSPATGSARSASRAPLPRLPNRSASASAEASASTSSSHHSAQPLPVAPRADVTYASYDVVEISSDSEDEVVAVGPTPVVQPRSMMTPSDFVEISGVRRADTPHRSDIFSPDPPLEQPAEPIRFESSHAAHRPVGISVDPDSGDFLTRPMPVVRPRRDSSDSEADTSFSIVSAQIAPPPQRSAHPITDQRLRNSNLAMPRQSPPRSKPAPIQHPLLSTFSCPICFDAPKNLVVTPCGHFFCGECLFQALKTQAIQRGHMEEEDSLFSFGSLFAPFGAPGTLAGGDVGTGASNNGSPGGIGGGGARTGAAAAAAGGGRGRGGRGGAGASGRGGGPGGHRGRNRPDPLAGHCPVCRARIKGAFNGRDKTGIMGLRLAMGVPVDDPREEDGKLKQDAAGEDGGSIDSSDTDEEKQTAHADPPPDSEAKGGESDKALNKRKRERSDSDASFTQSE